MPGFNIKDYIQYCQRLAPSVEKYKTPINDMVFHPGDVLEKKLDDAATILVLEQDGKNYCVLLTNISLSKTDNEEKIVAIPIANTQEQITLDCQHPTLIVHYPKILLSELNDTREKFKKDKNRLSRELLKPVSVQKGEHKDILITSLYIETTIERAPNLESQVTNISFDVVIEKQPSTQNTHIQPQYYTRKENPSFFKSFLNILCCQCNNTVAPGETIPLNQTSNTSYQ